MSTARIFLFGFSVASFSVVGCGSGIGTNVLNGLQSSPSSSKAIDNRSDRDDLDIVNKSASNTSVIAGKSETSFAASDAVVPVLEPAAAAVADIGVVAALPKGACHIVKARGATIFQSQSYTEDACRILCGQFDASNPYRQCSFNGVVFRETPSHRCLIVGQGGKIHFDANIKPFVCEDECSSRETTHPFRSCSFEGKTFRSP